MNFVRTLNKEYYVHTVQQTSWADKQFISQALNQGPTPNHDISNPESALNCQGKNQQSAPKSEKENQDFSNLIITAAQLNPAKSGPDPQSWYFKLQVCNNCNSALNLQAKNQQSAPKSEKLNPDFSNHYSILSKIIKIKKANPLTPVMTIVMMMMMMRQIADTRCPWCNIWHSRLPCKISPVTHLTFWDFYAIVQWAIWWWWPLTHQVSFLAYFLSHTIWDCCTTKKSSLVHIRPE